MAPSGDRGTVRFDRGYALIVVIADYAHVTPLPEAVDNDGFDLATVLRDPARCGYPGNHVMLLCSPQATHQAIGEGLDWLAQQTNEQHTAFIYFSCHGLPAAEAPSGHCHLIPYDAEIDPEPENTIDERDLSEKLTEIRARRLVVVLDCSHAGGVASLRRDGEPDPRSAATSTPPAAKLSSQIDEGLIDCLANGDGRVIIASSKATETSLIRPGMRNSLFTHYLLEALRGKAPNRVLGAYGACLFAIVSWLRQYLARCGRLPAVVRAPLARGLNWLRDRGADRGLGTVRIFQVFDYVRNRVVRDSRGKQEPQMDARLGANFPVALRRGRWVCLISVILAFVILTPPIIDGPNGPNGPNGPEVRLKGLNGVPFTGLPPVVKPPFQLEAVVRRLPGPMILALRTGPANSTPFQTVAYRPVPADGTKLLPFALPENLTPPPDCFALEALLFESRPEFEPPFDEKRPVARSGVAEALIGALDLTQVDGKPLPQAGTALEVPVRVAVEGKARHLAGATIEILTRPLDGRGVPERRRGTAMITSDRWQAFVPVRDPYVHQRTRYELWGRTTGHPAFSSARWPVRIQPPTVTITAIEDHKLAGERCVVQPHSRVRVAGRAEHVLTSETLYVAVLGEELWRIPARINTDGSWAVEIEIGGGTSFAIYVAIQPGPPDMTALAQLGARAHCHAAPR